MSLQITSLVIHPAGEVLDPRRGTNRAPPLPVVDNPTVRFDRTTNVKSDNEEIDWTADPGDPDGNTSAVDALFPHGPLKHALDAAGFADVKIKCDHIDRPVFLTMRLGRIPHYASVRDVRVAVQRIVRSIGFTVLRGGFLLRLHTGRVTAKFRVAKRRPG